MSTGELVRVSSSLHSDSHIAPIQTTNRVGNIPQYWYDDMPHIGYDIDGKKVMRPATGDELDRFLTGVEDEMGGWANVVNKNEQEIRR